MLKGIGAGAPRFLLMLAGWGAGALVPLAGAQDMPPRAAVCVACHGPGGHSVQPGIPILAGQTARYLTLQLRDFREGRRSNAQMSPMAADLSREDMRQLSDYFAQQKPRPSRFEADPVRVARGRVKAAETLCTMCHLGGFAGQNEVPRVAGQHPDYVMKQLRDFRARVRTNDAGTMTSVAGTLSDTDIEDLAHYLASL